MKADEKGSGVGLGVGGEHSETEFNLCVEFCGSQALFPVEICPLDQVDNLPDPPDASFRRSRCSL